MVKVSREILDCKLESIKHSDINREVKRVSKYS